MLPLAFQTGRDTATFWDKETEVPSFSRDKGTTGKAKNLAKGRAGTAKIWDGTRDKTGRSRKGRSKTGKVCSKTEKDVCSGPCPGSSCPVQTLAPTTPSWHTST